MVHADPPRAIGELPLDDVNPPFSGHGLRPSVSEIAAEAGIDLADASDLDADNVPADEENDRVMQAPD